MALLLQRRSVEFDPPPRHQIWERNLKRKRPGLLNRFVRFRASPLPPKFMSLNRLVLVLNASYEAIHVTSARRALTLVFKGAAIVEEVSAYTIRTSRINVPVPS